MKFTTYHVMCQQSEAKKQQWDSEWCATSKMAVARMLGRDFSKIKKERPFDCDIVIERLSMNNGSCVFSVDVGKNVGVAMLALSGKDDKAEQKSCMEFQKRCHISGVHPWSLPLPPLEIAARPLFYYVFYQILPIDKEEMNQIVLKTFPYLNAIGVAFNAHASKKQEQK